MRDKELHDAVSGVQLTRVSRKYGKKFVLDDVTLEVRSAEVFGLLGPSGAGKTTIVKLIAGIDKPTRGTVVVNGVRMPRLAMQRKIGYMAQSDALYMELTAYENLDFFATLFSLTGKDKRRRIREVMDLVNLTDAMNRPVHQYSGGMKRRLSLAIALLHRPKVLILDEPTVGIDPLLRAAIWSEFETMSRTGTTIIVTTHVMDEAEKCHRLGMIRNGRVIATGSPAELKENTGSKTLEEAFLVYGGARA
jgi:ABC-2 type transport system ATP-binding protein